MNMKKMFTIIMAVAALALSSSAARATDPPSLVNATCADWTSYIQVFSDFFAEASRTESQEGDFKTQAEWHKAIYLIGLIDSANNIADYFAKNGEKDTADRIRLSNFFFDYKAPVDTLCAVEANGDVKIAEIIYDAEILLKEEQKKEK